jgi:hypothetical protein
MRVRQAYSQSDPGFRSFRDDYPIPVCFLLHPVTKERRGGTVHEISIGNGSPTGKSYHLPSLFIDNADFFKSRFTLQENLGDIAQPLSIAIDEIGSEAPGDSRQLVFPFFDLLLDLIPGELDRYVAKLVLTLAYFLDRARTRSSWLR